MPVSVTSVFRVVFHCHKKVISFSLISFFIENLNQSTTSYMVMVIRGLNMCIKRFKTHKTV